MVALGVGDIVGEGKREGMATYNIFRHTSGVPTPWISRYIGVWGCCACTLLASPPAPALSTLTCMRPIESHPETFCVGVSDSGDAGRIRGSGRINNVHCSCPCPFIHHY